MSMPPTLTDRTALIRNRKRGMTAPFLHETAMDEIKDRLSMVNKTFTAPVIVTGFPDLWQGTLPAAPCITDEDTLALTPDTQDLVVHAMSLHWANDLVGQLVQCRRALRPDGLFMGVLLGGETLHQLRASLAQAESEVAGGLSPRVAPMAEIRDLGGLLQRAGFALPVADSVMLTASYASPTHLMHDLRAMGETSAMATRPRHFTRRKVMQRAAEIYQQAFALPDGRIPATFELIFLIGWAPDASQPQPLRPGSAKIRLADALGSHETPLRD